MIIYFTGTGNSRWVAERLAKELGDEAFSMIDFLNSMSVPETMLPNERLGIVFPIYSWSAPRVVTHFLSQFHFSNDIYCYAVCTCGDDVGKGMSRLARRFRLDAAWSVPMPNTYIPMFNLDDEVLCHKKIKEARSLITTIAADVVARRRTWSVYEGKAAWLKTYVINPLFVHFVISSKGFHLDDGCVSCGLCATLCPVGNIKFRNKRPVWDDKCIHCMACVHACPQRVIQYKKTTQQKGRYHLTDYLVEP